VKAASARAKLLQAGVYGRRVSILVDDGKLASCPESFANVVTSEQLLVDGTFPYSPSDVVRRLTPYGGTVLLGRRDGVRLDLVDWRGPEMSDWEPIASATGATLRKATRGALAGAGQWSHPSANAANTACSEDRLVGAANLRLQWLGTMGPEHVINRHLSPVAPLFHDGRLFVVGRDRVQGIDAYNGTLLWTREIKDVQRIMVQLNTGQFCANSARLFVAARDSCLALEPATGELKETHAASLPGCDWGYLAVDGDVLVGSSQTSDRAVSKDDGEGNARVFLEAVAGGSARAWPVLSRQLFARKWQDGALLWTYGHGDRLILNRSLCLAEGRIYLVESRSSAVLKAAAEGRVLLRDFTAQDAYHTALDLHTGKPVWEKPLGDLVADHTINQCSKDGVLVLLRSHFDAQHFAHYTVHGLEAATGQPLWSNDVAYSTPGIGTMTNLHNRTLTQPTLVGRTVLLATTSYQGGRRGLQAFDLKTGRRDESFVNYDQQKGCAPISASATALFHRGYQCAAYDLNTKTNLDVSSATRPSCWISMIPAGGLLLMPEGSHGCDCGQNIQTSMALAPRYNDRP
jgi:outer membrane protein assembly factor BamB